MTFVNKSCFVKFDYSSNSSVADSVECNRLTFNIRVDRQ